MRTQTGVTSPIAQTFLPQFTFNPFCRITTRWWWRSKPSLQKGKFCRMMWAENGCYYKTAQLRGVLREGCKRKILFTWCTWKNGLRKRKLYTSSWAGVNCFASIDHGLKEQDCKIGKKEDWEYTCTWSHGNGWKMCGSLSFPSMSTRKCPPQWSHCTTTWIKWLEYRRSSNLYLQPATLR